MSSSLEEESMTAWKIYDYKGLKSLKLVEGLPIPKLTTSKDVLVEVKAASVNVMDILMAGVLTIFNSWLLNILFLLILCCFLNYRGLCKSCF